MSKCVACINGQTIKEGLDFDHMSVILTFELGVCSWCLGRGFTTGD